jgi:hypothetical protein
MLRNVTQVLGLDGFFGTTQLTENGKKNNDEELHNLYTSPRIIRIIKSRRLRWTGHVARMGPENPTSSFGDAKM